MVVFRHRKEGKKVNKGEKKGQAGSAYFEAIVVLLVLFVLVAFALLGAYGNKRRDIFAEAFLMDPNTLTEDTRAIAQVRVTLRLNEMIKTYCASLDQDPYADLKGLKDFLQAKKAAEYFGLNTPAFPEISSDGRCKGVTLDR